MLTLKPFVPEGFCLSCQGCCRYPARDTVWAPLFLFEEILELTQANILPSCIFTHPDARAKTAARIDLVEEDLTFICPCLETKTNKCKIYSSRPFDCQLYPFLLASRGNEAYLAIDTKCPYGVKARDSREFRDHVRYLEGFLTSKEFLKLAGNDPGIVQHYAQDVEFLLALPLLSRCVHGTSSSHTKR